MKIRIALVAFLATCNCIAYSQIKDFDLSTYKLPYMKRHSLDFSLNANNSYSKNNREEGSYLHYSGSASVNYGFYLNSDKIQNTTNISYSGNAGKSESNLNNYSTPLKSNEVDGSISLSTENRYYWGNLFFIETDIYARTQKGNSRNDYLGFDNNSYTIQTSKNKYLHNNVGVPIKIGKGRIERVEDARLAVYILDDFAKLGILNDSVSKDNILLLAETISMLKNKTVFDTRISRIQNITALDSILQSMGIVKNVGASYFTSIFDNWLFSNGPIRESGHRLALGFSPYYQESKEEEDYINSNSSQHNIDNRYTSRFKVFGEYNYCKPLNLFWQFNLISNIGFSKTVINDFAEKKFNFYYLSLSPELSYYPNSRTSISYNSTYSYNLNAEEPTGNNRKYEFLMNHTFSMNYYISPKLTVQASETLFFRTPQSFTQDYYYYSDDNYNKFSHQFNIGFYYKFL